MVRENPNKESCYERIKELIKEKKSRNQVIQQCQKEFIDVHKTTFYTWYDDVKEKDINDMILSGKTKEEVQKIIKDNTYQGTMAKIRFATWRKRNA